MGELLNVQFILPSLILAAGVVDDLRSKKVHNWLSLSLMVIAVSVVAFFYGWPGVKMGLFASGITMLLLVPMVYLRMLGAGDLKIMLAFSLASSMGVVVNVIAYSFIWGALLGVMQVLFKKQGHQLIANMTHLFTSKDRQERAQLQLHTIPFTVALLFGWMTYACIAISAKPSAQFMGGF